MGSVCNPIHGCAPASTWSNVEGQLEGSVGGWKMSSARGPFQTRTARQQAGAMGVVRPVCAVGKEGATAEAPTKGPRGPPGSMNTLFEDAFRYTSWAYVHRELTNRKLPSVEPKEALRRATARFRPAVILDVREEQDYAKVHAANASSAPLFRLIQGSDLKANLRRLGYALITDFAGTERNPDFLPLAEKVVGGDRNKTVLVICGRGGTLETTIERTGPKAKSFKDPERVNGIASRSLKACFELQQAGFKNVVHVKGGLNQWLYEDLPWEGEDEQ